MFDAINRFRARHRPHATALVRAGEEVSFRTCDATIDHVGASRVVLLALARLGVATVSFAKASELAVIETGG